MQEWHKEGGHPCAPYLVVFRDQLRKQESEVKEALDRLKETKTTRPLPPSILLPEQIRRPEQSRPRRISSGYGESNLLDALFAPFKLYFWLILLFLIFSVVVYTTYYFLETGEFPPLGINETKIEYRIHELVNEKRSIFALRPLEWNQELADIADKHSEDMAKRRYYEHVTPEGLDLEDRFAQANFECLLPAGPDLFLAGGENLFYIGNFSAIPLQSDYRGTEIITEYMIAEAIVNGWMNSPGHRQNLLNPYWDSEGIGVYIIDNDVYVTQDFC